MHKTREVLPPKREVDVVCGDHDPVRKFERVELPVRSYLKLAQIRGERNPVTGELKESIMSQGLLYEPISARVSEGLFREYLNFTGKLWGSKIDLEDLASYRQDDGSYFLIIAGHSRHQAFDELIDEGRLTEDQILPTKVAEVKTVWDIIALQRADNIHSAPPKERNAMATIEAYEWGIQSGDWSDMKGFIGYGGEKISEHSLREMQSFARLPGFVRSHVLEGIIPYSVGVEMGKGVKEIRRYYALEAGYSGYYDEQMSDGDREKVDELVTIALDIDCAAMLRQVEAKGKLVIMAAKNFVRSTAESFKEKADSLVDRVSDSGLLEESLFELSDPLTPMLLAQRRELTVRLRELTNANRGAAVDFIGAHIDSGLLSPSDVAQLINSIERRGDEVRELQRRVNAGGALGSLGLATAELAS